MSSVLPGMFTSEVQFGHAGSCANSDRETATAKNAALKASGAFVPESFDSLGETINEVYVSLVKNGTIVPQPEVPPPTVPMDYSWARVSFKKSIFCFSRVFGILETFLKL